MFLGQRLEAAISLLETCGKSKLFADIGSDHAYLAIEAMARGLAEHAVASDINPAPLESGREHARARGISPDFVLSDGFDRLESLPLDAAAVCGMGGDLIAGMLKRSTVAKNAKLILQPMSKADSLRSFLWSNGFEIISEAFAVENKKPYVLLLAEYTGKNTEFSVRDTLLGKSAHSSKEFDCYAQKVILRLKKQIAGQKRSGQDTAQAEKLLKECQTQKVSR